MVERSFELLPVVREWSSASVRQARVLGSDPAMVDQSRQRGCRANMLGRKVELLYPSCWTMGVEIHYGAKATSGTIPVYCVWRMRISRQLAPLIWGDVRSAPMLVAGVSSGASVNFPLETVLSWKHLMLLSASLRVWRLFRLQMFESWKYCEPWQCEVMTGNIVL